MPYVEEIKEIIITSLGLEDITKDQIESNSPLFGEGLGLDSIDALELGIAISKKYDIILDVNSEGMKESFASVNTLSKYIENAIQIRGNK